MPRIPFLTEADIAALRILLGAVKNKPPMARVRVSTFEQGDGRMTLPNDHDDRAVTACYIGMPRAIVEIEEFRKTALRVCVAQRDGDAEAVRRGVEDLKSLLPVEWQKEIVVSSEQEAKPDAPPPPTA